MEEEKMTVEEMQRELAERIVAEVTLMHQYNIARDAILPKDGYHGVNASFVIEWLLGEISKADATNREIGKAIVEEITKNVEDKKED